MIAAVIALGMAGAGPAESHRPADSNGPQEWRSYDGRGNNLQHPDFGRAGTRLRRLTPVAYRDGVSMLAGAGRPSARVISNALCAQSERLDNPAGATDLFWVWGQFVDHDMDLTPAATPSEHAPIHVPAGDPHFDPLGTGRMTIPFTRSVFDPTSGTDRTNPRHQVNEITAFIDASNVYGSDAERAAALRRHDGSGRLKTSRGRLLPFNRAGLPNTGGSRADLFLAGDVRANEQVGLTALHTVWVREHNRLARLIKRRTRKLSDEEIYQRARAIVGAELQVITYREFLPVLLGPGALRPYTGYDPQVDPGISNIFSTVAFRFGHSMLPAELPRLRRSGRPARKGPLSLREAFFNPRLLLGALRIPQLLRGLEWGTAQHVDLQVIDDVRNFLFGRPGAGGLDLAALNVQRGRDHGLADYNTVRRAFGLAPALGFADITADVTRQQQLAALYGDVNDVDVWVGGLAEDEYPGALVGELFFTIIKDQFERLRDGDRFWYARMFDGHELEALERTTLAAVLRSNTRVGEEISDQVFFHE